MSLPEAAGLILQAGAIGESGDTFVLDMGDPLRIVDVAKSLITLSGLKYPDDIDIVFTGLRPGEKLSEELTYQNETLKTTPYEKLMVMKSATGKPDYPDNVRELLNNLPNLETKEVKTWLQQLVPEYQPSHLSNELDK
jgi:FlaA1/EpsC-like NDP-sugar epimerase